MQDAPVVSESPTTMRLERLAVGADEAAAMIGVGRTLFLAMDRAGELGPQSRRFGARRLWATEELRAWVRAGMPPRGRWIQIWPMMQGGG